MALTAIVGVTKATTQKSSKQMAFEAKEALADATAVACPAEALKSIQCSIKGENEDGPFGTNTIGQKIEGKIIMNAADAKIRTFAHELVTKTIQHVKLTTISGVTYTFASAEGSVAPVVEFAYDTADLVTPDNKAAVVTLLMTGYRDNQAIS